MKVVYWKSWVKIQQMYENLELDLDLKLMFMVTGAYYESGLSVRSDSSVERDSFRGNKAVLKIKLLGKGLTQEISGDRGSY